VDPGLFPDGVNVEFVNVVEAGAHVRLRVSERGVGETRSVRDRRLRCCLDGTRGRRRGDRVTVTVDVLGGPAARDR
jgi:diaminopimelate epimerase